LIFIVVTIVIGMGISWNFSSRMLTFIEKPLTGPTYLTELKKDINVDALAKSPYHPSTSSGRTDFGLVSAYKSVRAELVEA
jgi:hypothetical protein